MHFSRSCVFVGLVVSNVVAIPGVSDRHDHGHEEPEWHLEDNTCYGEVTVMNTETALTTTTLATTCIVEVTDYVYVNSTITQKFTENTTKTLHHTVNMTDTETLTETDTDTETLTDHVAITETDTDSVTVTTTDTDGVTVTTTDTVPATITTYTTETETLLKTSYDPCPKSCSIDAATVTLFYWPTDRPYTYPSTYVDEDLDYTFVSPSVYMLIPSAKGTNSKGQHVGPSTTNWILDLDLHEVSTIADGASGSLTRQLELSDLGTNCPQSMDPTAIATLNDSRCAPVLAAPTTVSTWAFPCNACGGFGLFDPPYAVPTITGLIEPTTTEEPATTEEADTTEEPPRTEATATAEPSPSSAVEPTGTVYVVYHENGVPVSTDTMESAGMSGETTSSVAISVSAPETSAEEPAAPTNDEPSVSETGEGAEPSLITPTDEPSVVPTPSDPDVVTASAMSVKGSVWQVLMSVGAAALILTL